MSLFLSVSLEQFHVMGHCLGGWTGASSSGMALTARPPPRHTSLPTEDPSGGYLRGQRA